MKDHDTRTCMFSAEICIMTWSEGGQIMGGMEKETVLASIGLGGVAGNETGSEVREGVVESVKE